MRALADLDPEHPPPGLLLALLSQIDQTGLAVTIEHHQDTHDRWALAQAWINTSTGSDSLAFHRRHKDQLATAEIRELLAGLDTDIAHQRIAILGLAAGPRTLEEVYDLVTDAGTAEAAALDAIETGDLDLLPTLVAASPALHTREVTLALIAAVLALADGETDTADAIAGQIAQHAERNQRRAYAVHLRGLHHHAPQLDGLAALIEVLARGDADDNGDD